MRWSVWDTAHLIINNKGDFNKNIRWSVLDTAHLIIQNRQEEKELAGEMGHFNTFASENGTTAMHS